MANVNWQNARSNASNKISDAYADLKDDGIMGVLAWLLLIVFVAVFCKVISVNVMPYAIVFGDKLPIASGIPIVGWFWDVLTMGYVAMGSLVAWAIVNFGQCLWILISLDRRVHRSVLSQMSAEHKIQSLEGRSSSVDVRRMQKRGMKLPAAIIVWSGWIALGCYVAELVINLKAYPPVNDFGRFLISISLGKFEIFNVENIAKLLWGMFSTEVFLVIIIVIYMWIQARKPIATEQD